MLDYRAALRAGLSRWDASAGAFLSATYAGPAEHACDTENVLIYNVGHAAFAHLPLGGVALCRASTPAPPPPAPGPGSLPHYHRYELRAEPWSTDSPGGVVAEWRRVPLHLPLAVEAVWYAVRTSASLQVQRHEGRGLLGLDVVVGRPPGARPGLLGLIKALVDGLVSAFHAHDGRDLDVVAERLGIRTKVDPHDLAELLVDDSRAALGTRRLVWPYRQFVQWNPADDAIVDLRITTTISSTWFTSGMMRAVG